MTAPALALVAISRAFAGIHAVREVTLALEPGRVLGLVGENGAGKSTLMNIVGGVIRPDGGEMRLAGLPYAPRSPADAAANGIAFIHQELNLFGNLTIAENIFANAFPRRRFGPLALIDRKALAAQTRALLAEVSLDLSPDMPVDRLSPGERQIIEIAKALQADAGIIIFDEPTTSLTAREIERLFALIGRLRAAGKTMVYISHILGDVMALADDVAILRDGALVASGPRSDFTIPGMITAMVGRSIDQLFPPRRSAPGSEVLLTADGVDCVDVVEDIGLALHAGEVLGIFGLMGSGRTELARILFGLDRHDAGSISVGGREAGQSPCDSIAKGVAFVTENRRDEGLLISSSIADNIALAALQRFALTPAEFVEDARLRRTASGIAGALGIRTASLEVPAKSLSGGNQQKVVLAKWLMTEPSVFILDEPTRGVDVGAKYEIYAIIDRLAADGGGILFISSEIEELLAMCDRILVMSAGEIVGEFQRADFDRARILSAAFRETGSAA